MTEPAESRATPAPAYALAALCLVAPQLLGGATAETELAILALTALASAYVALHLRKHPSSLGVVPCAGAGAILVAGWTLIQTARLPCAWLAWAEPDRHALMVEIMALVGPERHYCSISAAPGATLPAAALATTLATLLLASVAVARQGGRNALLYAVALSSVLMACVALGHWALGADSVFGLYVPEDAKPRQWFAPLLNENHLAGHMALGFPLCLSLAFSRSRLDAKIAWFNGALVVLTTGLLSLSRGGAGALVLGGAVYLGVRTRRGSKRKIRSGWLATLLVGALCAALGAFFAFEQVAREFEGEGASFDKLSFVVKFIDLINQHPLVGIGRRALGDVSPQILALNARAEFVESLPIQWLVEWGIPATVLLFVTLLFSAVKLRPRRDADLALCAGLLALGAQNLVDFSLELAGVASVAAVALGVVLAKEKAPTKLRLPSLRGTLVAMSGAALIGSVVASPWLTVWSRQASEHRFKDALTARAKVAPAALAQAFLAHPVDPGLIVLAANLAVQSKQANAGRWLNLAMRVAPGWAPPHMIAANVFERRGDLDQAAMELSLAATLAGEDPEQATCNFVKRHPVADLVWEAASQRPERRLTSLETLIHCLEPHTYPVEGEALLSKILEEYPHSLPAHERFVAVGGILHGQETALQRARNMLRQLPNAPSAYAILGQALVSAGRSEETLTVLSRAPPKLRKTPELLLLELDAALARRDLSRFNAVTDQLLATSGRTAATRAEIHRGACVRLLSATEPLAALAHAQRAHDLSGTPEDLELIHRTAVEAGVLPAALRAASELCHIRHHPERYCREAKVPGAAP